MRRNALCCKPPVGKIKSLDRRRNSSLRVPLLQNKHLGLGWLLCLVWCVLLIMKLGERIPGVVALLFLGAACCVYGSEGALISHIFHLKRVKQAGNEGTIPVTLCQSVKYCCMMSALSGVLCPAGISAFYSR